MTKRYQIDREQAVRRFHKQAEQSGQELQLHLPLKEIAAALQQGVGELMRQAGLELMQLIMDNEVRQLAGEHYQRREAEQPYRWGREKGFLVVDGQKVPIQRPRLRSDDGHEQSLGSYALFRRSEPLDGAVWDKLMLGLSTRNYSKAVREFAAAYGIEKSAVSEHFVRTSRQKLQALLERPLDKLKLCAIYIDGIEFKGQHLVAALGVAVDGSKTVLGLRQGASENATVVSELLEDLAGRGVDFWAPMLYVLDGAKALTKAVRKHAGKTALIQRCQMHKRRNVTGHLPEQYRESVDRKMANAYAMSSYEDVDVVHFAVGNADKRGDVASQVQQRVHLHGSLALAELGPREQREAQVDGGRVQSVETLIEIHADRIAGVQGPHDANQDLGEIGMDPPVARLVSVGQCGARHLGAESHVVELGAERTQARFDIAEAFAVAQLGEGHR